MTIMASQPRVTGGPCQRGRLGWRCALRPVSQRGLLRVEPLEHPDVGGPEPGAT
jgi:hypothetical protein